MARPIIKPKAKVLNIKQKCEQPTKTNNTSKYAKKN